MLNWYNKIKISQFDPSFDSFNEADDAIREKALSNDESPIKSMCPAINRFQEGMIVRDRKKWKNPEYYGKIDKIKNGKIKIKWFDEKREEQGEDIFDAAQDTIELNMLIMEK